MMKTSKDSPIRYMSCYSITYTCNLSMFINIMNKNNILVYKTNEQGFHLQLRVQRRSQLSKSPQTQCLGDIIVL